jgi:hypothetical protein
MDEQPKAMTNINLRTGEQFSDRMQDAQAIAEVVNRACRRAVAEQGRAGLSAVVWRNGRVTWLQPSEVAKQIPVAKPNWIDAIRGSATDNPVFDEIVRLGKEIRDAERPPE